MKIIVDTNVWYQLPENPSLIDNLDSKITFSTFLNYFELLKTRSVVSNANVQRKIINEMDKYQKLFTPPFVHIAKLHKYFHFKDLVVLQDYIYFLIAFKNGDFIDPIKINSFFEYIDEINTDFSNYAETLNQKAAEIKMRIKDNKKHLAIDSTDLTNEFLLNIIRQATQQNIENFDFSNIELLSKTLNLFFKKLEVGEFRAVTNDIVDFFLLSYVQPGDLYLTKEKKWINLIKQAGCENYLHKNCE